MRKIIAFAAIATLGGAAPAVAQWRGNASIPPGQRPPAGMCRIWIDGVPPGRQPRPTDCRTAIRMVPRNGHVIWGDQRASNRVYTQGGVYDPRVYDQGIYNRDVYDRNVYNQRVYEQRRREAERWEAERWEAERREAERREAERLQSERRWEMSRVAKHDRDHDGDRDDRWQRGGNHDNRDNRGQHAGNRDDRWQRASNHDDHDRNGHR